MMYYAAHPTAGSGHGKPHGATRNHPSTTAAQRLTGKPDICERTPLFHKVFSVPTLKKKIFGRGKQKCYSCSLLAAAAVWLLLACCLLAVARAAVLFNQLRGIPPKCLFCPYAGRLVYGVERNGGGERKRCENE